MTSAPVSSLNAMSVSPSRRDIVHEDSCLVVTVPREAVSRLSSWAAAATVLEKHCELKCPFLWHLWHVGPRAGHLSAACHSLPHRLHCGFFAVWLPFLVGANVGLAPHGRQHLTSSRTMGSFFVAPYSCLCCSLAASFCRTCFFAFSSVSSASIWRCSDSVTSLIPMTIRSRSISSLRVP